MGRHGSSRAGVPSVLQKAASRPPEGKAGVQREPLECSLEPARENVPEFLYDEIAGKIWAEI